MFSKFGTWRKTKTGLLIVGLAELAIAYGFGSLAIDRGSWWWYVLTLIFFVGGLRNLATLIGRLLHGKHKASKA